MANITSIDATIPGDSERIRLGAQRIRETRAKLNEVITQVNDIIIPALTDVILDKDYIYWDVSTSPITLTIPAGYTKMNIMCIAGGAGGGGAYASGPASNGSAGGAPVKVCGGTVDVVAGQEYSIVVGAGGNAAVDNTSGTAGFPGTASTITKVSDSTVVAAAQGGNGGAGGISGPNNATAVTSAPVVQAAKQKVYEQLTGYSPSPGVGGDGSTSPAAGDQGMVFIRLSTRALEQ